MITDQKGLALHEGGGTVTGVDISKHRLATCRSLARKYRLYRTRLFHGDGTRFEVGAPSLETLIEERRQRKGTQTVTTVTTLTTTTTTTTTATTTTEPPKPFHAPKMLLDIPASERLYDRVIVDAECTHDGSIAHIMKYCFNNKSWDEFDGVRVDPDRMEELKQLQRNLLLQGYRMLRPGGTLVYSTCSFSRRQNEDIVAWFLMDYGHAVELMNAQQILPKGRESRAAEAQLNPVDPEFVNNGRAQSVYESIAAHRLRLHGYHDGYWMSGLFIVKLKKL